MILSPLVPQGKFCHEDFNGHKGVIESGDLQVRGKQQVIVTWEWRAAVLFVAVKPNNVHLNKQHCSPSCLSC